MWMRALRRLARLAGDRRGHAAMMVALMGVPLVGAVGLAVDGARAVMVRSRLASASDAAALAGGRVLGAGDAVADARRYFWVNIPQGYLGATIAEPVIQVSADNETLTVTADASVPTTFARVLGVRQLPLGAANKARRTTGGLEVALVLDTTGSMNGSRIAALRDAATSLVDILFTASRTPDSLWIAVVPYVASVNLGANRGGWLTLDSPKNSDYGGQGWYGCLEARPAPNDQTDETPDRAPFKAYLWKSSSASKNVWPPITAYTGNDSTGPNLGCGSAVLPLTNDQNAITTKIKSLNATFRSGTMANLGLQAGWFTLSPKWRGLWGGATPAGLPLDYGKDGVEKAIVLMTDGENNWNDVDYTAYGTLSEKRLGTSNRATATGVVNDRMATLCTQLKATGIRVYTITLGLSPSETTTRTLYQNCASDPGSYFDSPSPADLDRIFRTIGTRLSRLRLES
jgi:Flp pilus assembly protein TadG